MGTLRFTHPTDQWQPVGWLKERSDVPINNQHQDTSEIS